MLIKKKPFSNCMTTASPSLKSILATIPSVNYVDFTSTKQAMLRLLDTNDHVVSFTKKIRAKTSLMNSFRVRDMVYFEYPVSDYASIDFISEIDSNAIEMYLAYNVDRYDYKKSNYTRVDTIITSAMYGSTVPSLILGFDALFIPEEVFITMSMSLVPMNIFNKIRDDVFTDTCFYDQGAIFIKDSALIDLFLERE